MLRLLCLALTLSAQPNYIDQGAAAMKRQDYASARTSFEAAAKQDPYNPEIWAQLAKALARLGEKQEAIDAAAKAESLAQGNPAVLHDLAFLYGPLLGDASRAAAIHTLLGRAYAANKNWSAAANEYKQALKLRPYDEDAHFRLAQVYLLQQDFQAALDSLQDSRRTFDRSPQLELALGVTWYGLRRFPEAIGQFLRTIDLAPDVPQPYLFLGRILDHAGERLPEIESRFIALQKRSPDNPIGYLLHAKALITTLPPSGYPREAETAETLLLTALARHEPMAEAHLQLGILLERKPDLPAAAKHLERSIQLNPADPAPHYRLARVYTRLGRRDEAAEQRALHEKLSEQSGGGPLPTLEPSREK